MLAGAGALASSGVAIAGPPELVDLGSGWQVLIPDNDLVLIVRDNAGLPNLILEKVAGMDPGIPLDLVFTQYAPNSQSGTHFLITEESILNMSGSETWVRFDNQLVNVSNGAAVFNVAASATFSIGPEFTAAAYYASNTGVQFSGGVGVAPGAYWLPGQAAGALQIDVTLNPANSAEARTTFTLRETPNKPPVPTPGATVLVALAGVVMLGRRRRR